MKREAETREGKHLEEELLSSSSAVKADAIIQEMRKMGEGGLNFGVFQKKEEGS